MAALAAGSKPSAHRRFIEDEMRPFQVSALRENYSWEAETLLGHQVVDGQLLYIVALHDFTVTSWPPPWSNHLFFDHEYAKAARQSALSVPTQRSTGKQGTRSQKKGSAYRCESCQRICRVSPSQEGAPPVAHVYPSVSTPPAVHTAHDAAVRAATTGTQRCGRNPVYGSAFSTDGLLDPDGSTPRAVNALVIPLTATSQAVSKQMWYKRCVCPICWEMSKGQTVFAVCDHPVLGGENAVPQIAALGPAPATAVVRLCRRCNGSHLMLCIRKFGVHARKRNRLQGRCIYEISRSSVMKRPAPGDLANAAEGGTPLAMGLPRGEGVPASDEPQDKARRTGSAGVADLSIAAASAAGAASARSELQGTAPYFPSTDVAAAAAAAAAVAAGSAEIDSHAVPPLLAATEAREYSGAGDESGRAMLSSGHATTATGTACAPAEAAHAYERDGAAVDEVGTSHAASATSQAWQQQMMQVEHLIMAYSRHLDTLDGALRQEGDPGQVVALQQQYARVQQYLHALHQHQQQLHAQYAQLQGAALGPAGSAAAGHPAGEETASPGAADFVQHIGTSGADLAQSQGAGSAPSDAAAAALAAAAAAAGSNMAGVDPHSRAPPIASGASHPDMTGEGS